MGIMIEDKPKPVIVIKKQKIKRKPPTINDYFIKRCKKYNYTVFKYDPMMFTSTPAAIFLNENTKHINIENIRKNSSKSM